MTDCPYCGKEVKEGERYCWHCENDISKVTDEEEASKCFIATAAYGRFAQEIEILREFRDKKLKNNFLGNKFIDVYYKISPGIAKIVYKNEFLKKIVRMALKPIIKIVKKIN